MEMGSKAARWKKGPAQSWLGFQQVGLQQEMEPLKARGWRAMNEKMGRVKGTNRR